MCKSFNTKFCFTVFNNLDHVTHKLYLSIYHKINKLCCYKQKEDLIHCL